MQNLINMSLDEPDLVEKSEHLRWQKRAAMY